MALHNESAVLGYKVSMCAMNNRKSIRFFRFGGF